jgi:REP element-mobilizing transposase RayT
LRSSSPHNGTGIEALPGTAGVPPADSRDPKRQAGREEVPPLASSDHSPELGGRDVRAPREAALPSAPPRNTRAPRGWYSRGYLPHFDYPGLVQSITFRLADALPLKLIAEWKSELEIDRHTPADDPRMKDLRRRIDRYEDAGHGSCVLRDPRAASLVENALLHFDWERYRLIAWCVMPNHVHTLIEMRDGFVLSGILHSWKSYTSKEINKLFGTKGQCWFEDYRDRFIRDERHFHIAVAYIENNSVKAGLCRVAQEWLFSSAKYRELGGRDARGPR